MYCRNSGVWISLYGSVHFQSYLTIWVFFPALSYIFLPFVKMNPLRCNVENAHTHTVYAVGCLFLVKKHSIAIVTFSTVSETNF